MVEVLKCIITEKTVVFETGKCFYNTRKTIRYIKVNLK